ncbi:MAG: sensor histidine kinase [Wenzhouxiangella sp.]
MAIISRFFGKHAEREYLRRQIDALARENERMFAELVEIQQDFSHLARSTWRVQEDERRHLARELHDHLGQTLTALVHGLEAESSQADSDHVDLARKALEDTRELSRILRPPVLDDLGLEAALQWLARRSAEVAGFETSVSVRGLSDDHRDQDMESLIFRICQEALNNAVKHAQAGKIELSLSRIGNILELRIRDDGVGFDPAQVAADEARGIGLIGMQDRVRLFGGTLHLNSAPGRGTAITVTLNLDMHASSGNVST